MLKRPVTGLSALACALMVGMALRLAWALAVPVVPVSDSFVYNQFAQSILAGKGFAFADGRQTAYWAVGTSAVYAWLYGWVANSFAVIVGLNLALGAALIVLTHALAKRYVDEATANRAAWLMACWPLLIQFTTVLASELLFIALLLAALVLWGSRLRPLVWRSVLWGAALCAAVYVRPTALPLFALLPALELRRGRIGAVLLSAAIACVTAAVLLAPWVERNRALFGEFVLVSSNFGANLWMGNNPASQGAYMDIPDRGITNEAQLDRALKEEAKDFISAHPLRYAAMCVRRVGITYLRESIGVAWNSEGLERAWGAGALLPLKLASNAYWYLILLLCAYSASQVVARRSLPWRSPLVVTAALFFVVPVLTVGQDRYHMPMMPFMAIFAAWGLGRFRAARAGSAAAATPA